MTDKFNFRRIYSSRLRIISLFNQSPDLPSRITESRERAAILCIAQDERSLLRDTLCRRFSPGLPPLTTSCKADHPSTRGVTYQKEFYAGFDVTVPLIGMVVIRLTQNEMIGTHQTKSLTCTPRKSQSHGTAREKSTRIVRIVSLFLILRNLITWSLSTSCFSSCAIKCANPAMMNREPA